VPFRPDRLKSLREVKGLSQEQLGNRAGLSHPVITKSENGKNLPRAEALDKLAQALDCTMDYLHGRGQPYENTAIAAAHMAFDVFLAQRILSEEQREMCRRVLRHRDAPKTAEAWHSFAEMLDWQSRRHRTSLFYFVNTHQSPSRCPLLGDVIINSVTSCA
jgi:transcriptional regulator with XRE-family HTH domain